MAVAGLVLGILAAVFGLIPVIGAPLGVVLALIGIPLSAVALSKSKKTGEGKGMALAGLICGIVALPFVIFWAVVIANVANDLQENAEEFLERQQVREQIDTE